MTPILRPIVSAMPAIIHFSCVIVSKNPVMTGFLAALSGWRGRRG
jgi:hypothetical protein